MARRSQAWRAARPWSKDTPSGGRERGVPPAGVAAVDGPGDEPFVLQRRDRRPHRLRRHVLHAREIGDR